MSAQTYIGATLKQLEGALNTFQLEHGRYPSQREGLSALVTGPSDTPQTNFIAYIKTLPKDWWDRDYVYRFPGVHNPESFDLYSLGEDGVSKTGGNDLDDINHWNERRPWAAHYSRWRPIERAREALSLAYYRAEGEIVLPGVLILAAIACAAACVLWRRKK